MHRFLSLFLIIIHGFLVLQFYLIRSELNIDQEWVTQFFLLLFLQFLLVILQIKTQIESLRIIGLTFSCIVVVIMAVPFRNSIGVGLSLFLILVLEGALHKKISIIIAPTVVFALTLIFIPRPETAWDMEIFDTTTESIITILVIGGTIIGLLVKLVIGEVKDRQQKEQIRSMKNTVEELSAANLGYSTFAQFAQHRATVEERNRITREIHDGIGYTLTNIIMLSEASIDKIQKDQQDLQENLKAVRVQAKNGLYDTRKALRLLRAQEDALPRGLDAIQQMIDIFSKATGTEVDLQINVTADLIEHPAIFLTIYRFVQESLTNSFRHGHATKVEILSYRSDQWIVIIIRDNGIGVNVMKEGIGLQGMRERIEFVGGKLDYSFRTDSGSGFTVIAQIPVQGEIHEN